MSDATSKTLLGRVRDPRDEAAWSEFFRLYAPLLERFARSHGLGEGDAEELRDQCLALVVKKMPDFEYSRAKGGFKGWLYRIARGAVIDQLRRPSSRQAETHELGVLLDRQPSPDQEWEDSWRVEHLRHCLDTARTKESERTYAAFELLLLEELSVPEVCERMDMNANQVYKAKARILERVRAAYERIGAGPTSLFGHEI